MLARHGKSNMAGRFERRSIEATENPENVQHKRSLFSAGEFYGMNLIHQLPSPFVERHQSIPQQLQQFKEFKRF